MMPQLSARVAFHAFEQRVTGKARHQFIRNIAAECIAPIVGGQFWTARISLLSQQMPGVTMNFYKAEFDWFFFVLSH